MAFVIFALVVCISGREVEVVFLLTKYLYSKWYVLK